MIRRHTDMSTKDAQKWARTLKSTFEAGLVTCEESKVVALGESIRKNIKRGMTIYIGGFANATGRELIRQFRGTNSSFTVIGGSRDYTAGLVKYGLVKKLIGAAFGYIYPVPGPSPVIQKAHKEGSIEIEDWTVLTLIQRLMAGAMDMACMTTKSMIGSSIAQENTHAFKETEDPFGSGQRLAYVKALNPDIALIHGWAADPQGNIITGAPNLLNQDVWGARASRKGVIATVEKIVDRDFVRDHSCLVTIPSHIVSSLSLVPLGAHPQGMPNIGMGIKEFQTYDTDYEFIASYRAAERSEDRFDKWLKEWVFDCPSEKVYLNKLGDEKVESLKKKIDRDTWKHALVKLMKTIPMHMDCTKSERMMVIAAREIKDMVLRDRYKVMLTGMGASLMASWLAYYHLREEGYTIKPTVGIGLIGYSPRPGNPANCSLFNAMTAEMTSNSFETYGVFVGGLNNNRCLSVLGAGQIDKNGNINSSRTTDGSYLMGSGGANDATNAQGILVVARQSKDRFVDKVNYVTCQGDKVKVLVSDKGVFKKLGNDMEFTLTNYIGDPDLPVEEGIRAVREDCGWELRVSPQISGTAPPTIKELMMLRAFDPEGLFRTDGAKR